MRGAGGGVSSTGRVQVVAAQSCVGAAPPHIKHKDTNLGKSVHKRKRRDNCIGTSEDPAVAAGTVAGTRSVQRPSKLRKYQSKLVARLAVTNFGCYGVLILVSGTQPLVPPSDVAHCT